MALGNVSCQKPPLRMELSWNFRGFPYCQSLCFKATLSARPLILACVQTPPSLPPKKIFRESGFFWGERGGGGGICTQANWYDSHANNTLLHVTSFWRREFLELENGGLFLWILIPYQCVTRKETQPVNAEVFPVVAFLYRKVTFRVKRSRRVRRLKETTAKSYCFHACCFKECGF